MKIRGNTVGTPMKRPDFNQTDPKKSDYIKNNPIPKITEEDKGKVLIAEDGKFVLGEQTNEKLELDLTNLKAIAIGNTWILDEEKIKSGDDFTKDFKFVSNGIAFSQIACYYSSDSGNDEYVIQYRNSDTGVYRDAYRCDLYNGEWSDDAFKTIRTAEDINLEDIAKKVESTNDLITDAKTLIDAINELSKSVKFVPVTYVEPVEDEDGNVIEEGGWFAERKDEFGNFVRDVAITALVGGENKFVFYERQPLIEGGAFSPIYIDKFIDIESVDNAIDFIDQIIASTWKRLPEESQEGIIEFIDNANTQLKTNLTNIYNWIMGLGDLPDDFKETADKTIKKIGNGTKTFASAIYKWFTGDDGDDDNYDGVVGNLREFWDKADDKIKGFIDDAAESFTQALVNLHNEIWAEINDWWENTVVANVEELIRKALAPLQTLYDNLKKGHDEFVEDVEKNVKVAVDNATLKLDEIVEFFGGDLVPDQNFAQITNSRYNSFVKNNSIDTLDTLDTTVVGGINELNRMIQGNTWVLDEEALLQADSFTKDFKFVSNGIEFEQMVYRDESDGANDYHILQYRNNTTDTYMDAYNDGWIDRAFRTVFTYNTRISLEDIATIDNYTREDLDTNDKTIVGAINEVNASVNDAKGTLQNIIDGYTEVDSAKFARKADELSGASNLTTTNKTTIGAINEVNNKVVSSITELEDAGADIAEIKSYGVAWSNQSRIHFGDGEYVDIYRSTNIPLVAGENITFTPVGEDAEIIKVNAEVDTSKLATVDKVKRIDTWAVGVENIDKDDGIYWDEGFIFFDENDNAITDGTIHHRIPIVAGNGVEFENDGNVITINATGGNPTPTIKYSEGLDYSLNSDNASYSVAGVGTCTDTDLIIPPTYEGLPVTDIVSYAFISCTFNSVFIPKSVIGSDSGMYEVFGMCDVGTFYCEAETQPDSWYPDWAGDTEVVWGYVIGQPSDAGGGNENAMLSVTVKTDYPTTMSAIINAIQDAGGDLSKLTFVTLTGYTSFNLAMSFAWRGGNYYRVECIDIGNMEKIYNPKTDNSVYDVTSMRIENFLNDGRLEEEMPQIRFTTANGYAPEGCTTFYVDEENPLKLTVEIVGGGALQAGDQLQVCRQKRFNGSASNGYRRKFKLQRFEEYVVTEEDLNKRFLTVNIFLTDETKHGLFRDGKETTISPLYLRIRRAKGDMQDNDSGQTVDAEFSNIVTIWKSYHRSNQLIRIY